MLNRLHGIVALRAIGSRAFGSRAAKWSAENAPVIVSAARTPIGSFNGALSSLTATQLGSIAIREAIKRSTVDVSKVDEVICGNVLGANLGQAPTRQASIGAGLPWSCIETTVNKVCSSGMKSIMFAAQEILTGQYSCIVAGGFESMSNAPYYLTKARKGYGYGNGEILDAVIRDGLWDAFDNHHMGSCAEACATNYKISREVQDQYALEAYRRAQEAVKNGLFKDEIVPVEVKDKKGSVWVKDDEEPSKLMADKVPKLNPAFKKDGTVTAANSSKLNDGAAAVMVTSAAFAKQHGLKPIARILGFADAARASIEFTIAPSLAMPKAVQNAGLEMSDVQYWEINEAFSVVALANNQILNLSADRVNVNGGAVSMGHPIGCSGARIVVTLMNVLNQKNATIGVAGICNGGGGASAIVIERLS